MENFTKQEIYCPFCKTISHFILKYESSYCDGKKQCPNCKHIFSSYDDYRLIDSNYVYEKTCKCGNKIILLSQKDREPEYYASIQVFCSKCNELNTFDIAVN